MSETHLLDDIAYEEEKERYARIRAWVAIVSALVQFTILACRLFVPGRIMRLSPLHYALLIVGFLLITLGVQRRYWPPKPPEAES